VQILSRKLALVLLLLSFVALLAAPSAQAVVLGYPTPEDASFLVDVPDDWEVEPGEGEGDYVHVNSPDGVYLAFRTIPGSEDAIKDAIAESAAYLQENYQEVTLADPKQAQQAGRKGFYIDGSGKDADGVDVTFRMAWVALDGEIGEIWFAAPLSDKAGIAAAGKAINSFRTP
jgi:hypothetical protein